MLYFPTIIIFPLLSQWVSMVGFLFLVSYRNTHLLDRSLLSQRVQW